jgi:tetratricopeptide (TPR) repeat protein
VGFFFDDGRGAAEAAHIEGTSAEAAGQASQAGDEVEEAISATRAGDYERARAILAGLIVAQKMETALELLGQGRARDALLPLDEALELDPRNAQVLYMRGRAAFATATTDTQPQFFYEDALSNFEAAAQNGYGIQAIFAASRAARLVPNPTRALQLAHYGARAAEALGKRPELEAPLERTWAEAAFDVYRQNKLSEGETERYFKETEDQLQRLLGRTPEDPWAYTQLANLYQWEERLDEALAMLERALALAPNDETLNNRVVELIRSRGGREAVIERYERFRREYPEVALGAWYSGVESFYLALEKFEAGEDVGEAFIRCERDFAACRELEPGYDSACRGYEIMSRGGLGWCRFNAGDLEGAKRAFMSMEDLRDGGLRTTLTGQTPDGSTFDRLPSGIAGLDFVTRAYSERSAAAQGAHDVQDDLNAAAIADYLHAYDPSDPNLANNAGFLNRDAATALERDSRIPRHAAQGESDPQKKAELAADADRLLERAQELMQRSYAAYIVAAELAPEDVRIVNDAGLVMAYYLRSDAEAAERYFLRAIQYGNEQLAGVELTGGLNDLEEAWGDAHQNMGVLCLTLKNDPRTARDWYQKSVEIGPPSRQWITDQIIPRCDRLAAGGELTAEDRQILDAIVWLHNPQ